jgi:hypothetical protein
MTRLQVTDGDWLKLTDKGARAWSDPLVSWGPREGDVMLVLKAYERGQASTRNHSTGSVLRVYRKKFDTWVVDDPSIRLRLDSFYEKCEKPADLTVD